MPKILSREQIAAYRRDGFVHPVKVMPEAEAREYRARLEALEASRGGALDGPLRHKPHLIITWLNQLVRLPKLLDAVEDLIGHDILVWSSSFFTKEARDPHYVSWHQDSTYWGLDKPDVVTAWIAFSPSTVASGCMQVIPGSHTEDQLPHTDTHAALNMLSRGQEVAVTVDESRAVDIELRPGEISLHNIRLVHGSPPSRADDRRIGFAVRYIPPHVRQVNGRGDSATLVRGFDRFGHFDLEPPPKSDMHPDAMAWHRRVSEVHGEILYQGTDRQPYT